MQWIANIPIILIICCIVSGCVNPSPEPAPLLPRESFGGSNMAISFSGSDFSTQSPEAEALFTKGLALSTSHARYEEATGYFDKALAIDKNFSQAWLAKAVALHNLKRYDEAISCYDRALELTPEDASTWHLKSQTLRDAGRSGESETCDLKAAALDPRYKTPG